jgi:hypothetical protein
MQYQIIGKDNDGVPIVLWRYDKLALAREKFDFVVLLSKHEEVTSLLNFPSWKSIELQQVETISISQTDNEP